MPLRVDGRAPVATEDYFRVLADRARMAGEAGSYAIAAALVIRAADHEVVCEGWNTLFAERDPSGHAEMNAIRLAHACSRLPDERARTIVAHAGRQAALHVHPRPGDPPSRVLYTTLEPCPMCTVCLINAGVDRVVIAAADPPSGTLEPSRLARLPEVWPELAGGIEVVFCQSTDPSALATYLPPELQTDLLDRFSRSRDRLDGKLGSKGVLDFAAAAANAGRPAG
jgi:tRNA(Arg) A34 adenosine deaminase TadA